jgi:acyl-homoserine lactone acylase PvdQ
MMSRTQAVRIILGVPLVLALAAGAVLYYYYRSHEIAYAQDFSAQVRDNVHIRRSAHGAPFIQATDRRDAMLALGFVQAQDR